VRSWQVLWVFAGVILVCFGSGNIRLALHNNQGMILLSRELLDSVQYPRLQSFLKNMPGEGGFIGWSDSRRYGTWALLLIKQGDLHQADEWIARALTATRDPRGDLTLVSIIHTLQSRGDFVRWYSIFQQTGIEDKSWRLTGYLKAANEFETAGQLDDAEVALRRAIAVDPSSVNAHSELATFLEFYRRDLPGAISEMETLVQLDPAPERVIALAARYRYVGRYNEALKLLEQVQSQSGGYEQQVAIELGWIKLESGDPQGALNDLESALKSFPNSAELWDVLAHVYVALGRLDDSLRAGKHAIALDPNYIWSYIFVAQNLLNRNELLDAEMYFQKAVVLSQGDRTQVIALSGLGDVYMQMKQPDRAVESFCQAERINRWGESEDYIKKQIQSLGGCP
jgi:tetratricopeptide (TPR) repeat protein